MDVKSCIHANNEKKWRAVTCFCRGTPFWSFLFSPTFGVMRFCFGSKWCSSKHSNLLIFLFLPEVFLARLYCGSGSSVKQVKHKKTLLSWFTQCCKSRLLVVSGNPGLSYLIGIQEDEVLQSTRKWNNCTCSHFSPLRFLILEKLSAKTHGFRVDMTSSDCFLKQLFPDWSLSSFFFLDVFMLIFLKVLLLLLLSITMCQISSLSCAWSLVHNLLLIQQKKDKWRRNSCSSWLIR